MVMIMRSEVINSLVDVSCESRECFVRCACAIACMYTCLSCNACSLPSCIESHQGLESISLSLSLPLSPPSCFEILFSPPYYHYSACCFEGCLGEEMGAWGGSKHGKERTAGLQLQKNYLQQ